MSKKLITVRLPEELLQKKPADLSLSDWIRECIHLWILENEKTKEQIISNLERASEKINQVSIELKTEELEEALEQLEKITHSINKSFSKLRRLRALEEQVQEMIRQISKSFICKVERYERW